MKSLSLCSLYLERETTPGIMFGNSCSHNFSSRPDKTRIRVTQEMVGTKRVKEIGIAVVLALSRINNAQSSNITLCDELLVCLEIIAGVSIYNGGADNNKDEFCDVMINAYGGDNGVKRLCDGVAHFYSPRPSTLTPAATPSDTPYFTDNPTEAGGDNIVIQATCKDKAPVNVPDLSGDNTGYDIAVASLISFGYIKDGNKRFGTDSDRVGDFLWQLYFPAIIALGIVSGVPLAESAAATVLAPLEVIKNQIDFHNGAIDAAEINASMENGNLILEQTCEMFNFMETEFNEVDAKLDQANVKLDQANEKLNQANAKLDQVNAKLDQANQKLDDLLCPFGPDGAAFNALRQGCDAVDQDCNGVVDECAEDKVPPSLTLQTPIPDKPFKSTDEALQFLQENVIVSDDCAVEFGTAFELLSEPSCCDCEFQVTTVDARCINENTPGATANRKFIVKVDSAAPVINCGFFVQQDPFHVSGGFDPCGDLPVPFPGANDPLHIDKSSVGQGLFDVGLWYQIEVSAVMCSNHT